MRIVFSIGGSIVIPKELDVKFLKSFSKLIKKYKKKHNFSIVVGGGRTARMFQEYRKELGLTEAEAHKIGIMATQLNALFVSKILDGTFSNEHPEDIGKKKGLYISGGYKIGWTTDTDAAYIAKAMNADYLVNITDVKGVYTRDPGKYKDAKFIPELDWKGFFDIVGHEVKPGGHYVFDPIAGEVCHNNNIKVIVMSKNLKNLEKFLNGRKFTGTVIG